jgi:aspartyl-tRNA(Asn)/glutamyl-tRNA(Gln) amidotransferase subunit A
MREALREGLPETAAGIAARVGVGDFRASDAVQRSLDRIAARNGVLNAVTQVNPAALADAKRVEARLAAGEDLPLAGVPVVVKDNLWVKGLTITQGSRLFADFVAPEDAMAVARLVAAGAVVVGVGACSEFACKGVTNTPLHGMTRNPVDPRLTPGGSSGGPAAAVAAGFAPLAIGTDAGGSTRRPPAHVGVIGFKPSQDLIPYGPGFDEPVWGISTICPIAREIGDVALAMEVLAGVSVAPSPIRPALAWARSFGLDQPLDAEVEALSLAAIARLRMAGFAVAEAAPNWPEGSGRGDVAPLQWAGLAALYGGRFQAAPNLFDPDIGDQITRGLALSGVEVAAAHQASHRMGQTLTDFLALHPFLLTPTTPCPAWPVELTAPPMIGGRPAQPRDHASFTPQANHAGCPAISLPCGRTAAGLPLGMQVMAAKGQDAALLALAMLLAPILAGEV